jgi:hypothetical protein
MKPVVCILGLSIALGACATVEVSRAPIASAEAAVQRAVESGAAQDEAAMPYLHSAREELARAERFARVGDGDRTRSMAMRAEADADLACTMTRASIARNETQSAMRGAHAAEAAEAAR